MQRGKYHWLGRVALLAAVMGIMIFGAGRTSGRRGSALTPQSQREAMPEVSLPDLEGRTWKLSEHRGKVVLLNFWASWCPPCREEMPGLVRLSNEYRSQGLAVAGISMDEGRKDAVRQFVLAYQISYPVLLPSGPSIASGITSLPTSILIDRKGRVAKAYDGPQEENVFRRDVEQLLAEPW